MTTELTVLSLFAGIGGLDLGLERTGGFETVAFAEIDPYASRILQKHWPDVPNIGDVTAATYEINPNGTTYIEGGNGDGHWLPPVDVIAAGFPCQDATLAWKGDGIHGKRTGLWSEVIRAARSIRPRALILENVPGLLARGFGTVLQDMAASGYNAEWFCTRASDVGALHERRRLFIIGTMADGNGSGREEQRRPEPAPPEHAPRQCDGPVLAEAWRASAAATVEARARTGAGDPRWEPEPDVARVAHGIPRRVDRIRCLGNAVVPQVAEHVGHIALEAIRASVAAHTPPLAKT